MKMRFPGWAELWREQEGLSSIEYALLLALVALVVIAAFTNLGDRMSTNMTSSATKVGNNPNP